MDFSLQNVRTGESLPLDPERTLVGAARHATIPLAAGPHLAALVVRYPAGWVVHGLSEHPDVSFNRVPLRAGDRAVPQPFDVLAVGDDLFRFVAAGGTPEPPPPTEPPPTCLAYIQDPDGMEECRAVDHDLLFGRHRLCHVWFPDGRLSRLAGLLAAHAGEWFVHTLSKGPVGRNRRAVNTFAPIDDGDELQIGPLVVRIEIRPAVPPLPPPVAHDHGEATPFPLLHEASTLDTPSGVRSGVEPAVADLHAAGMKLEHWLKEHTPEPTADTGSGVFRWLGTQKQRLSRFWYDTPEATSARSLRAAGRLEEAFAVLDRAIRARPESPELLRELYRLYEAAGLTELCYRPLRVIEKMAAARGGADPWAFETLARVCEQLGRTRPEMLDRAVKYWTKLERATGVSYARERNAALAQHTLREGGFTPAADD